MLQWPPASSRVPVSEGSGCTLSTDRLEEQALVASVSVFGWSDRRTPPQGPLSCVSAFNAVWSVSDWVLECGCRLADLLKHTSCHAAGDGPQDVPQPPPGARRRDLPGFERLPAGGWCHPPVCGTDHCIGALDSWPDVHACTHACMGVGIGTVHPSAADRGWLECPVAPSTFASAFSCRKCTFAWTSCLPPGPGSEGGACHPMEVMHDSPWCHLAPTQVNGSPNAIIMTLWTALDYQDSLTSQSDTVSRLLANQLRMLQVGLGASHCYGELPSTLGFQAPMWHLYAPCEAFTGRISAL